MHPSDANLPPPRRRALRLGTYALAVVVAVGTVGSVVRLPAHALGPGEPRSVGALIKVTGRESFPSRGQFLLTTVSVSSRPLTILEGVLAWLDPNETVVERTAIVPEGRSDEEQDHLNLIDIERSKYRARVVAFRAAGLPVEPLPGAYVLGAVPGSPADGEIGDGDRIVAVDGVRHATRVEIVDAVRDREVGDRVRLLVVRDGEEFRVTLPTRASNDPNHAASIGVSVDDAFELPPVEVSIDTAAIGGPSGGLVFSLAITDALSPADLTGGLRIAATGGIEIDGTVREVGGVAQKAQAAAAVGADVFLVPAAEVSLAEPVAGEMRVIGVSTFEDAVRALRTLSGNETPS